MANWFTRSVNRVNNAIRAGLNRAFGGEQPTYQPPPRRRPLPPEEEPFGFPPEDQLEDEEPVFPEPPEEEPLGGGGAPGVYVIYGGGDFFGQPFYNTLPGWLQESRLPDEITLQRYGLYGTDIIDGLIAAGADYQYVDPDTGQIMSGLWYEWRIQYQGV